MAVAFLIGASYYDATECSGGDGGDCDLGPSLGFSWALVTFVIALIVIAVLEARRGVRRRRARRRTTLPA